VSENPLIRDHSDAAARIADTIGLHMTVDPEGTVGKYMAFKLIDGRSDDVRYDTRSAAIWHQRSMDRMMFILIPPTGMTPLIAERLLFIHRQMDDKGFRIPHAEDAPEQALPERLEQWKPQGLILPPRVPNSRGMRNRGIL
jgi:hypothetical protein